MPELNTSQLSSMQDYLVRGVHGEKQMSFDFDEKKPKCTSHYHELCTGEIAWDDADGLEQEMCEYCRHELRKLESEEVNGYAKK